MERELIWAFRQNQMATDRQRAPEEPVGGDVVSPEEPAMNKPMPGWMWLVGGLCMGALGFAVASASMMILFPLILLGLGFRLVVRQEARLAIDQVSKQHLALDQEMEKLNREIFGPDPELEAKFAELAKAEAAKTMALAEATKVAENALVVQRILAEARAKDEQRQRDLLFSIPQGAHQHVDQVLAARSTRTEQSRKESRDLYETVRTIRIQGSINCTLTRRPGRRVLVVEGTPSERRRLRTQLVDQVLEVFYEHEDHDDSIQIEVFSAALESVDIAFGATAKIQGSFPDLNVQCRDAQVVLEGDVKSLCLTVTRSSVKAGRMQADYTTVYSEDSDLYLDTKRLEGVLLDDQTDVRFNKGYPISLSVQGTFNTFEVLP